ncbi:hypothetical protein GIB67_026913 [Kingdonia uniflora]|uniref:DM2 domain-containing protein n=1 Tax=Kingdonia uniflora TaxID=39325 RepID=A0A7J7P218_9MAGN|nr:hypothetical protein GIB67_026913 [Kingdonia uniflora]
MRFRYAGMLNQNRYLSVEGALRAAQLEQPLRKPARLSRLTPMSLSPAYWRMDPINKNVVNCDQKLKSILLGKPQVELAELPMLIKLHFPKVPK